MSSREPFDGVVELDPRELLRIYHDFSADMEVFESLSLVEITASRVAGNRPAQFVLENLSTLIYDPHTAWYGFNPENTDDGDDYVVSLLGYTQKPSGVGQKLLAKHLVQVRAR